MNHATDCDCDTCRATRFVTPSDSTSEGFDLEAHRDKSYTGSEAEVRWGYRGACDEIERINEFIATEKRYAEVLVGEKEKEIERLRAELDDARKLLCSPKARRSRWETAERERDDLKALLRRIAEQNTCPICGTKNLLESFRFHADGCELAKALRT